VTGRWPEPVPLATCRVCGGELETVLGVRAGVCEGCVYRALAVADLMGWVVV
jgi:hypothetical protein